MANYKGSNNFEKQKYPGDTPKEYKNSNTEEENGRYHLLLSTTYGLNNSHTKRIHVGLQATKEGLFAPVVELTGNYAEGICFDANSWLKFQENMGLVEEYFSEINNKLKPDPLIVDNICINFTTSYGARSILVAYKEENSSTLPTAGETHDFPPAKKRKTYAVAIVMQKTTFLGLKNVTGCVNAHLALLQTLEANVNKCMQYLIKEIELNLPKSYVNRDIVKLTFKGNYDDIERNVRTQINDLTFLDNFFNLIFVEMTSLQFNQILRTILVNRES